MESHQLEGVREGYSVGHDFMVEPTSKLPPQGNSHLWPQPRPWVPSFQLSLTLPGPSGHHPQSRPSHRPPPTGPRPGPQPSSAPHLRLLGVFQACASMWMCGARAWRTVCACAHQLCLLTVQGSLGGAPQSSFSTSLLCLSVRLSFLFSPLLLLPFLPLDSPPP